MLSFESIIIVVAIIFMGLMLLFLAREYRIYKAKSIRQSMEDTVMIHGLKKRLNIALSLMDELQVTTYNLSVSKSSEDDEK